MAHGNDAEFDGEEDDFYDSGNVRDRPQAPPAGHNSGQEEEDALAGMELDDIFKEARKDLLKDLLKAVRGGYATPQEKSTLRQMLKDNGYIMGDPLDGADGGQQGEKAELPQYENPEYVR